MSFEEFLIAQMSVEEFLIAFVYDLRCCLAIWINAELVRCVCCDSRKVAAAQPDLAQDCIFPGYERAKALLSNTLRLAPRKTEP